MSDKESAQSVIEAYRKRQQMGQKAPMIIMIIAAIVIVVGGALLIFYLLRPGDKPLFPPRTTDTPTPTLTATFTLTPVPTNTPTETPSPTVTETLSPTVTATPTGPFEYTVAENDTLSSIAAQFDTDLATILALNPQIDPATLIIRVGDKILIPAPDTQLPSATPLPEGIGSGTVIQYTVVSGDTLEGIAARFNSTVEAIMAIADNNLTNANDIFVGQILKIPVNIATPAPTATITPTSVAITNTPGPSATP